MECYYLIQVPENILAKGQTRFYQIIDLLPLLLPLLLGYARGDIYIEVLQLLCKFPAALNPLRTWWYLYVSSSLGSSTVSQYSYFRFFLSGMTVPHYSLDQLFQTGIDCGYYLLKLSKYSLRERLRLSIFRFWLNSGHHLSTKEVQ